jgi:hypothetical protein
MSLESTVSMYQGSSNSSSSGQYQTSNSNGLYNLESAVKSSASSSTSGTPSSHPIIAQAAQLYTTQTNSEIHNTPLNTGYSVTTSYQPATAFLKPDRAVSPFIGSAEEIKSYIQEAFKAVTGTALPEDIVISILPEEHVKQKHEEFGGTWSNGVQGFSINRKGFGHSIIICKQNELDKLLLTVGHEIGHVMSGSLPKAVDEEAKAFAFEMAWAKAIQQENIAGLASAISFDFNPANNGLHDVAFNFVRKLVQRGSNALDVFNTLQYRSVRVEDGLS